MSASTVTSQLLPDPRTDEIGGVLPLFDRILELMRAADQFELLVARPQEIEDLARVARNNARVGRPLQDQRRGVVLRARRLPMARRRFEAPHVEPAPARVRAADPRRAVDTSEVASLSPVQIALRLGRSRL